MGSKKLIDVEIDVLINSIKNVTSGDIFDTVVMKLTKKDSSKLRKGWNFDWIEEMKESEGSIS